MGRESKILSECNVFDVGGSKASISRVLSNLGGNQFHDIGSWYNGTPASDALEAVAKAALEAHSNKGSTADVRKGFSPTAFTNVVGWTPPYGYVRGANAAEVREHNLANAGAGKLLISDHAVTHGDR
jgi:pectate lyase